MRTLLIIVTYLLISSILISCGSTSTPYPEIIAYKYRDFNYELQLKYHVKGRGNVHTLSLSKYEFDVSNWIYLNSLKGQIETDSLALTYEQRKTEYPWKQRGLKGNVTFMNDTTVKINLQLAGYDDSDKIIGYGPYEFNGTYKLRVRQDTSIYNEDL